MMIEQIFLVSLISPFVWMFVLGLLYLSTMKMGELWLSRGIKYFSLYMAAVNFALFALVWHKSPAETLFDMGNWIEVGGYEFKVRFIVDLVGATYALMSAVLIGVIFRFSRNYLHKEAGYFRFIFLLSTLLFGLTIISFARSLDLLFAGWELVGATSVLLIGYFYTQVQPVKHALKAIVSYRLCDTGILAASAWSHHYLHTTDFQLLGSTDHHLAGLHLITIGLFIIWASLGKAGQLPMCSWLPAAMEGPTPSSAIFYGALSVHLGPFLLLRFHDYLEHFPGLLILIGAIGALSAVYATLVGRTRPDAKTMLAYATISQVGLIYVEIALGFTNFALFHIVAHASLRTYQFLRSSSLIQDFFENPVVQQNNTIHRQVSFERMASSELRKKIYIHALHGFHLDYFTAKILLALSWPARAFISFEEKCMAMDNRILSFLIGRKKP